MTSLSGKLDPVVRPITATDVVEALSQGARDFRAQPLYDLGFAAIYVLGGLAIVSGITVLGMSYLAYPLAAGFALIALLVAGVFYEASRERECGRPATLSGLWRAITGHNQLGWMAFVTISIFLIWMYQVLFLMALFLGRHASVTTIKQFIDMVLNTNEGLMFLAVGNLIGMALSAVLFSLTVVSFPLLFDRDDVDFVTAMITSVRAVILSPVPMLGWALAIVIVLVVSMLPFFLGLLVTLPVLGHASWHLYRRVVAALPQPEADVPPPGLIA
jgi:uncharacterized membrane protein